MSTLNDVAQEELARLDGLAELTRSETREKLQDVQLVIAQAQRVLVDFREAATREAFSEVTGECEC